MLEETKQPAVTLEPLDDYIVIEPSDEEAETRHETPTSGWLR